MKKGKQFLYSSVIAQALHGVTMSRLNNETHKPEY
jgi:hypothetical protein